MSAAVAVLGTVLLIASVPVVRHLIRRARRAGTERDLIVRDTHERARRAALQDPATLGAPYGGWMPPDVEDHLIRFLIEQPDVADGFARLRRIAEDQKGD